MIKFSEIAFSCYAVTDFPRARGFYEGVLGLTPTNVKEGEFGCWAEYEIGAHTISIGSAAGFQPSADGCMVALEVEDFDAAIEHLRAQGVRFRMEPMPTPVCRMAIIFDPDGNSICIHRRNTETSVSLGARPNS